MTIQDSLRINGPLVDKIHKVNTFKLAAKMRKNGCSEEAINEAFMALIKNPDLNPWGLAENIKKREDVAKMVSNHLKDKKEEMKFAGDMFNAVGEFLSGRTLEP